MHSSHVDLIVVGAGASGLIAAGRAAQLGAKVLLLEKMPRPARKLLITSNGRCNITNETSQSNFYERIYPNPRFLNKAFSIFFNKDIVALLNEYGVTTHVEENGRILPDTGNAKDVLQALLNWLFKYNVRIQYSSRVDQLLVQDGSITGVQVLKDDLIETIHCKAVCICTGGKTFPSTGSTGDGYKLAQSVGHTIETLKPALVPLITTDCIAPKLQGLSLQNVKLNCYVNNKKQLEKTGDLLFTHFGLSGPAAINISRFAIDELQLNNKVELKIDLHPTIEETILDQQLITGLNEHGKMLAKNYFALWMPQRMVDVCAEFLTIDLAKPCNQINAKERRKVLLFMKAVPLSIIGSRPFKEAMVTVGGVSTKEIDAKTMESKLIKGLYFAGEVMDLDADTGGYNLQIAWSTGYLAAESIVQTLNNDKNGN